MRLSAETVSNSLLFSFSETRRIGLMDSVGGKHLVIDPAIVFDGIGGEFPEKWKEAVEIRKYEKEEKE